MQSTGSLRLFDGLFVGDEHTARDEQFMLLNQITLVVNLTNLQIRNYYEHYDIRYVNFNWKENKQQLNSLEGLCVKINQNLDRQESVLIHELSHLDQAVTLCAIFLMDKFRWSLYKTLEYLQAKIVNLTFSPVSFNLLKMCQLKLLNSQTRLSYNWQIRPDNPKELVLRNTYLNCSHKKKNSKIIDPSCKKSKNAERRVSWNLKQISNLSHRQSHRVITHRAQEDNRKNRIILSVKKIIAQSANKENTRNDVLNKKINKNAEKLKLNKATTHDEPSISLKKYKSVYSLASLPSFQKTQNPLTEESQKCQVKLSQNLEKCQSQYSLKERIKTQKSERFTQTQNKCIVNKISLLRTENTENLTSNIDSNLSSSNSEMLNRKESLVLKKENQNISSVSKLSLRKPTPRKKYQITLQK